jgi:cytochrome c5
MRKPRTQSERDDLLQATEYIVDQTSHLVRAIPGYRRRLKGPVTQAFSYIDELVERIPASFLCARLSISSDPRVKSFFVNSHYLQEVFSKNKNVRTIFDESPLADACCALMCMRMEEHQKFGVALIGDRIHRVVLQTTVSFTQHQMYATYMRHLDKVTGTPERSVSPAGLRHSRRYGIVGLALVLIVAQPVFGWDSNDSIGEDLTNLPLVVDQLGNADVHGNERPVTPAASPPGEEERPAEADTRQASPEKYDLELGESVFNHTCLTCHWNNSRDAPRVSDRHVWQPRLAQGLDVLIQHAEEGHGRMPAKGGYSTLTDLELSSAVAYLYQTGMEILAKQDDTMMRQGCDPVSNLDQCSQEELKKLMILRMLWLLLGGDQKQ